MIFRALVALCCIFYAPATYAFDFEGAGARYGVSPQILEALSLVESKQNPLAIGINKNNSVDLGHMQINSDWNGKNGIDWRKLTDSEYCTYVGAWILANEIKRYGGNIWDAVAAYHIGKSPSDWEREAAQTEGRKRELALWRAARGRWYANMVYRALQGVQKRHGDGQALVGRDKPEKRSEQPQTQPVAAGQTVRVSTATASYVPNPYGSTKLR